MCIDRKKEPELYQIQEKLPFLKLSKDFNLIIMCLNLISFMIWQDTNYSENNLVMVFFILLIISF